MKNIFFTVAFLLASTGMNAQSNPDFRLLFKSGAELYNDAESREKITDLVSARTTDSVLTKGKQRHVLFLAGVMMNMVGMNWRAIEPVKQKFIGTSSRPFKMFRGPGKELDYNFFLTPHLHSYAVTTKAAFDLGHTYRQSDKGWRLDTARFGCPPELVYKGECLSVECEGTPYKPLMEEIDSLFMPSLHGFHGFDHSNFHIEYPTIGLYGPWVLDCNHNCRPEIHPIDWIWWLDVDSTQTQTPSEWTWYAGLFRDCSKRFEDWSSIPRTGEISIPFFVPGKKNAAFDISLETLIFDSLVAGEVEKLAPGPGNAVSVNGVQHDFASRNGPTVKINVHGNDFAGNGKGFRYEIITTDHNDGVAGYVRLYVSAQNVFGARIKIKLN